MSLLNFFADACQASNSALVGSQCLPHTTANKLTLDKVFTLVFVVLGALAFLMLVIAGFRYVISGGEPQKMAEIRRQIIYSLVGLIVAVLAAAIVNVVLTRL